MLTVAFWLLLMSFGFVCVLSLVVDMITNDVDLVLLLWRIYVGLVIVFLIIWFGFEILRVILLWED